MSLGTLAAGLVSGEEALSQAGTQAGCSEGRSQSGKWPVCIQKRNEAPIQLDVNTEKRRHFKLSLFTWCS